MDKYDKIIRDNLEKHKLEVQARKNYNLQILKFLQEKIENFPEIRFCQLLENLGLVHHNMFYEESSETYNKLVGND